MFTQQNILYVKGYNESSGLEPKNRYLIVLKSGGDDALLMQFITSKRYVPEADIQKGCIFKPDVNIHCYHFPEGHVIGHSNEFCFERDSFAYVKDDIKTLSIARITAKYKGDIEYLDSLTKEEFGSLIYCISKSKFIKRGLKKHIKSTLEDIYGSLD